MQNRYADILQIYPKKWGNLTREGGYDVVGDNMNDFIFTPDALNAISAFRPNIIFVQQEFYCAVTKQMEWLAHHISRNIKLVVFIWENAKASAARYNDGRVREVIQSADFIICGNSEAKTFVQPFMRSGVGMDVFPQVGLDTTLFQPATSAKKYDFIFVGRESEKKGWNIIEKAIDQKKHPLLKLAGVEYSQMYKSYQQARVNLSPVLDEVYWHEQHAGYNALEALSCGLNHVTSDSASIVEYLDGVPGVHFVKQKDVDDLREKADLALDEYLQNGTNWAGRQYVRNNFGFPVIAEKLKKVWQKALMK